MERGNGFKLSKFKNRTIYRYIGRAALFTPGHGIIERGKVSTGKNWREVLVFDFETGYFDKLFKIVNNGKKQLHSKKE